MANLAPHDLDILAACAGEPASASDVREACDVSLKTAYRRLAVHSASGLLEVIYDAETRSDRYRLTVAGVKTLDRGLGELEEFARRLRQLATGVRRPKPRRAPTIP